MGPEEIFEKWADIQNISLKYGVKNYAKIWALEFVPIKSFFLAPKFCIEFFELSVEFHDLVSD